MTQAPERGQAQRGGRRGFDYGTPSLVEWLIDVSIICGLCAGHRTVWCPDCAGFEGCVTCGRRMTVRCPECAGGRLDGYRW